MNEQYPTPPVKSENEPDREHEVTDLGKNLLRDYYQTFRLAQSELAIQPALFQYLAQQHRIAKHYDLLADALSVASHEVDRLLPPAHHAETTEESRNDETSGFRAVWNEYADILLNDTSDPYRSLELILDDMIAEDVEYQEIERPNRTDKQDSHESVVREYILGDKLVGSEQLKAVRDQLRATLLSPQIEDDGQWMMERFVILVQEWEANHPGQSFMPEGLKTN